MAFDGPDYELRWPRALFKSETADLLNQRAVADWQERALLLLEDAFAGSAPVDEFRNLPDSMGAFDGWHKFMASLYCRIWPLVGSVWTILPVRRDMFARWQSNTDLCPSAISAVGLAFPRILSRKVSR